MKPFINYRLLAQDTGSHDSNSAADSMSRLEVSLSLPHFVRLLQLAPASLYRTGRATGEFLLDSTVGQVEDGILFERVGNKVFVQGSSYEDASAPLESR
jgi:hypothetical protein